MQVITKKILDNFFWRVWFILEVLDSQWWVASQVGDFENSKVNITKFFESPKAGYVGEITAFIAPINNDIGLEIILRSAFGSR